MNMHMSSKNVAIQRTVYDALTREKRRGESFTALFRRLLDQKEGLEEMIGVWGRQDVRSHQAALGQLRRKGVGRR